MKQEIKVGGAKLTLTDKDYLASGGEAGIYRKGGFVYKIYHDPYKMIPVGKIKELQSILATNVNKPLDVVYSTSSGDAIGISMQYIDAPHPLCKLFTKAFKLNNSVDCGMINEIVKRLQLTVQDIHKAQCLVVDMNELNVLIPSGFDDVFMIDVDSYQTPSHRATAIMDSIRDRKARPGHFSPLTDWFSFGILATQAYLNIHPYKGSHPKYKPSDWQQRMEDGISIFDKHVTLPSVCNDFSVIPKRHLDWMKDVFLNNNRSIPPLADSSAPIQVPTAIVTIKGTDAFEISEVATVESNIVNVLEFFGVNYIVTKKKLWKSKKEIRSDMDKYRKVSLASTPSGTVVIGTTDGRNITFKTLNDDPIGDIEGDEFFPRNRALYSSLNGKVIENSFLELNNRVVHSSKEVENISELSTRMFEGMFMQDLLGKIYVVVPYELGACVSKHIPELDGHRIIDAKSEGHICVVIAEKGGIYDRYVIAFNQRFDDCTVRVVKDIAYDTINFTVLATGLCVLQSSHNEVEVFKDNGNVGVYKNPPFDSSMKLFHTSDGVFFLNGNSVFKLKTKGKP